MHNNSRDGNVYIVPGKRLRKKIREICGLEDLGHDEMLDRAAELIDNYDFKQDLCLKYAGLTHKDIERTLAAVLKSRRPKNQDSVPSPVKIETPKKKVHYKTLTREETRKLIEMSNKPIETKKAEPSKVQHRHWTREEVAALVRGDYHPDKFKYLNRKKK